MGSNANSSFHVKTASNLCPQRLPVWIQVKIRCWFGRGPQNSQLCAGFSSDCPEQVRTKIRISAGLWSATQHLFCLFLSLYSLFCDLEALVYWNTIWGRAWSSVLPVKAGSKPTRRGLSSIWDDKVISRSLCAWNCLWSVEQRGHLQDTHVGVTASERPLACTGCGGNSSVSFRIALHVSQIIFWKINQKPKQKPGRLRHFACVQVNEWKAFQQACVEILHLRRKS